MKTQEKVKRYLKAIEKDNKKGRKINAFLQVRDEKDLLEEAKEIDEKIKNGKAGKLAGKVIGIKANICVKGLKASCASKTLEDFKAPYDATVIEKIKKEDCLIIGICNMDEFAAGSSGESSAFGICKNPAAEGLIPGGSSSGSAAAVAAGFCDLALGSDTGGSVRNPASYCGVVGLKPSYSSVSRYGLIDLSMSLDQIGPLGKSVEDAALLFEATFGKDEKDSTSQDKVSFSLKNINKKPKELTIGLLELGELKYNNEIKKLIDDKVEGLAKKNNWKIKKVKIPHLDLAVETYYPLVYVEFFSGTRKFDGRRFGRKIEESAGREILRRILGGKEITKSEYGGRYYYKSLKVKKMFEKELEKVFKKVDVIVSPTVPRLPWKIGENISVEESYASDVLTIPYNLYGNCALSLPIGKINDVPVGMQIACDKFQEEKLFQMARCIEGF